MDDVRGMGKELASVGSALLGTVSAARRNTTTFRLTQGYTVKSMIWLYCLISIFNCFIFSFHSISFNILHLIETY